MARRRDKKGRFVRDRGWEAIKKEILSESRKGTQALDVGWDDPTEASKAAYNEFGTSRMPDRPFIRPVFDQNKRKYEAELARIGVNLATPGGADLIGDLYGVAETYRDDLEPHVPVDTGDLKRALTIRRADD